MTAVNVPSCQPVHMEIAEEVWKQIDIASEATISGEYDDGETVNTEMAGLSATSMSVGWHTDDAPQDRLIAGLVLRSDSHTLHVEGHDPMPLASGDLYIIDPWVRHCTICERGGGMGELTFFTILIDKRSPPNLYEIRVDILASLREAAFEYCALKSAELIKEPEDEAFRYRGIEPIPNAVA